MTAGPPAGNGFWGHYAGFVSRFVAYAVDLGVISVVFGLTLAAVSFAASLVSGHTINWYRGNGDIVIAILYGCWWLLYFGYSWAANGKTFGMALIGVRVVGTEGDAAGPRRAIIRVLVFPFSFLLLGLGFVGVLVGREHRALHDVVAGTCVVYIWDARAARLRFLARDELEGQLSVVPATAVAPGVSPVPPQAQPPAHETAVKQDQ
jgi:uncharacterized RDD family membrane protein YckC